MKKFLLITLFCATTAAAAQIEDTVATVNGKAILLSEYRKELGNVLEQYKQNAPMILEDPEKVGRIKKQVLDDMVDKVLLQQEADKKKVKVFSRELESGVKEVKERFRQDDNGKPLADDQLEAAFLAELKKQGISVTQFEERIRRDLAIRKFVNESIRPEVKAPGEKDVEQFFEKVKTVVSGDTTTLKGMEEQEAGELVTLSRQLRDLLAPRVHARHILIRAAKDAKPADRAEAKKKAEALKKQLAGGGDFDALARKNSQDPDSAARGGDLGTIVPGMTVPEFEKAAFKLNVGDISDVVETPFGYHIIQVDEKRAAKKLNYEEVKDDLAQFMFGQRLQRKLETKVSDLRKAATVETFLPKDSDVLGLEKTESKKP